MYITLEEIRKGKMSFGMEIPQDDRCRIWAQHFYPFLIDMFAYDRDIRFIMSLVVLSKIKYTRELENFRYDTVTHKVSYVSDGNRRIELVNIKKACVAR